MSRQPVELILIAAVAENGVIGQGGTLPWRLKSDMAHFRAVTMGKPVVMGRKTYQSIGKPLPGRTNIVVTRDRTFTAPGIVVTNDVEAALAAARDDAKQRGVDEIMVIGGTDIFVQTMPLADKLEITHVHARPEGDVFFPPIDARLWRENARSRHAAGPNDETDFSYVTYTRA